MKVEVAGGGWVRRGLPLGLWRGECSLLTPGPQAKDYELKEVIGVGATAVVQVPSLFILNPLKCL